MYVSNKTGSAKGGIMINLREMGMPYLLATILFLLIIGLWESIVYFGSISPLVLPPPHQIAMAIYDLVCTPMIWGHLKTTFLEFIFGFLIAASLGVIIGYTISQFGLLEKALYPYIIMFQAFPKIAIAPLILIWFGFGIASKIVIAVLVSFFPVMVNATVGFKQLDQNMLRLLRSLSASKSQILFKARLPNALPYVFAGLEVGMLLSLVAVIVGEFVGARSGLGYMIMAYNFNLNITNLFALLFILSVIGVTFYLILRFIRQKVLFWSVSDELF
jgi:NitT/TauT family transport system permease protein